MEPVIKRPRFPIEKTEDDLKRLLDMKESKNTNKATKSAVNIFRTEATVLSDKDPNVLKNFPPKSLSKSCDFFTLKLRKKGENFIKRHH